MSRIGKAPINLADGVTLTVSDTNLVTVKGAKGELQHQIDRDIKIEVKDNEVVISRPTEQKRHKSMHGLYRSLIANMVKGVSEGYKKELELVGVGYRASNQGQLLDLAVGYSHPIVFALPDEVKVTTEMQKGQNPKVILESTDNQLLGLVASKIRSIRKPEPYKGKGIKYSDEVIRRKAGKSAAAK